MQWPIQRKSKVEGETSELTVILTTFIKKCDVKFLALFNFSSVSHSIGVFVLKNKAKTSLTHVHISNVPILPTFTRART